MSAATVPTLRIGSHEIRGRFALSPMAEFTSWPMRVLSQEYGAAFACTEMVKAKFVAQRHDETMRELRRHPSERLCGGQVCGGQEDELAAAARILVHELGFPFVDFNIACPIRRIISDGAGSGLLGDPPKVERLVRILREASAPAPVTVKMRSGLDEKNITAVEAALAAEAGGAVLIALHPRTARQGYGGLADHSVVAKVKAAVKIPVVGGGDMKTPADAVRLMRETGCDAAYFARAAIGDPWIFARAQALLETGAEPVGPTVDEWRAVFRRHAALLREHLGDREACLHLRKLSREYAKRLAESSAQRLYASLQKVETMEQFEDALAQIS
ncbi:MAG: tRNA-dihydrouridine synthase [Planctomycetota bacterium]|nr:tRNA-dihydrouridine synthase [Planctomycetota bacterium]